MGTVDNPDEFVSDELKMRWGPFGEDDPTKGPLVYFGGLTEKTVVGLGGSLNHVIGQPGTSSPAARPQQISGSIGPILIHYLMKELGMTSKKHVEAWEKMEEDMLWARFVELTTLQMRGSIQKLEFLAKRLLEQPAHENYRHVLLGTPLYVAMAE